MLYSIGAGVQDWATLPSDPSATSAAYRGTPSIWAVTSVLPPGYDYAGAHNAINPGLCGYFCAVTICFYQGRPLSKPGFRYIKFTQKLPTTFGTILIYYG
ncbi:MAG: hypothetical protein ACYSW4_06255 [Planctomycetota bacterium]